MTDNRGEIKRKHNLLEAESGPTSVPVGASEILPAME